MDKSAHFRDMMEERGISQEWVDRVLQEPDRTEDHDDGTKHYLKQIPEYDDRWLRIVVNVQMKPNRLVTPFFDRRLEEKT